MERLIICQGTAQLVTAVSALHEHIERSSTGRLTFPANDHLLVCGLGVHQHQVRAFSDLIESMADLLHPFASIRRMSDVTLGHLGEEAKRCRDHGQIARVFQRVTGLGKMDEVFTARNWQLCTEIALGSHPDAMHVCYGDSVGVCLPKGYMEPTPTPFLWGLAQVKRMLPTFKFSIDNPRLDISYLLLPGAFGTHLEGIVVQTKASNLRRKFTELRPLLDKPKLDQIRSETIGRPVWVLLGSNFSEQGLMSIEAEVAAYREWIKSLRPESGTVLLIKTHPRDRAEKRSILMKSLEDLFEKVWSADSVASAYLPVEILLLELGSDMQDLRCLTVSTACLGTHFIVGSETYIGLGETIVRRYIPRNLQEQRIHHEKILRKLCMN